MPISVFSELGRSYQNYVCCVAILVPDVIFPPFNVSFSVATDSITPNGEVIEVGKSQDDLLGVDLRTLIISMQMLISRRFHGQYVG